MLDAGDAGAVAAAFRLGNDPVMLGPVAHGEVGQVWRLTTSRGEWAVKETFEPPPLGEVDDHAAFQELVAATAVRVPIVRRTPAGAVMADIHGVLVRVYSWVDVLAPDSRVDPIIVGQTVAAIHRVRYIGSNPIDPWYIEPVGSDIWRDLARKLRAGGAPFAAELTEQLDDIVALEGLLVPPETLQTCHRDLFADNVLPMRSGGVCVIDWENAGLADPTQELALVVFEFACDEPERARLLHDAYVDAGGPGRLTAPAQFSMLVAQLGHIAEVGCRRWLDPARREDRARNQARVEEFLTRRCTTNTITTLLDAIR